MIYRNMKNLSFRGLTGSVSFTSTGDRIPKLNVLQFQWDMETNSRCSLYLVGCAMKILYLEATLQGMGIMGLLKDT